MRYSDALTVGDIMQTDVVTTRVAENVEDTYRRMLEGRFRHMPVVGEGGKLVGIVSDRDLRNVLVFVNEPAGGRSVVGDTKLTIGKVMTRDPLRVEREDSVRTAIKLMIKHKVGCLPVCDENGKLLGIVTETDMLKLLAGLLGKGKKAVE
jgi:CBS domain-containing protein